MYWKFYKLLKIKNFHTTILLIPTRNNGMVEEWNSSISCNYLSILSVKKNQHQAKLAKITRRCYIIHIYNNNMLMRS